MMPCMEGWIDSQREIVTRSDDGHQDAEGVQGVLMPGVPWERAT